jgi:hypothetical protein
MLFLKSLGCGASLVNACGYGPHEREIVKGSSRQRWITVPPACGIFVVHRENNSAIVLEEKKFHEGACNMECNQAASYLTHGKWST